MHTTVIAQEQKIFSNALVNDVYRLRHETFIGRLDWDIDSANGMERDCFDNLNAYHIAVKAQSEAVLGCWRALPTTTAYMLKDVFPQLLQGECAPELDNVWEISRFAVRKGSSAETRGYMNSVTIDLVRSFYTFAQENGVEAYVTVTTVACERMLRQLGVNVRRFGEGKVMQVGKERSVALWIQVDDHLMLQTH